MKTTGELAAMLRQGGRKMTPQRQLLCTLLENDVTHPTAEALYESARVSMPTISLRTVYSVLNDLAELGQIKMLDLGTGATRFDPNVEAHHSHLVCLDCGQIRDLDGDFTDFELPEGHPSGFQVQVTEVVHRGRCATCAAQATDAVASEMAGEPAGKHPTANHQ